MDLPAIRYTRTTDGLNIAYQVVGERPLDLLFVPQVISNVEIFWENPRWAALVRELAQRMYPTIAADAQAIAWAVRATRLSATPTTFAALRRMNLEIDIRTVLRTIRVPTLVLHRNGDRFVPVEVSRFVAEQIPGAIFRELDGIDHIPWIGDRG